MTAGALLALLAALSYGVGDFVGGLGGRRGNAALIAIPVQAVGIVAAGLAILAGIGGTPDTSVLVWGAIGGLGSGLGNAALLRGLAGGTMSVVAPLSAIVSAALPAVVGVVSGERLGVWGWTGVLLALPAVALTSWSGPVAGFQRSDIVYGVLAGCGFGLLFIALDQAGTDAGAWPLLPGQAVALVFVSLAALPAVRRFRRERRPLGVATTLRWGVACGVFGSTANLLFLLATGAGQLSVVAVLAGLYPAVTVAMAAVFLHERIKMWQFAGLMTAAVAVVLIVTGA